MVARLTVEFFFLFIEQVDGDVRSTLGGLEPAFYPFMSEYSKVTVDWPVHLLSI